MKIFFKKNAKIAGYFFGVMILTFIASMSLKIAHAWTEPSVAPPGGNIGAPINTTAGGQTIKSNVDSILNFQTTDNSWLYTGWFNSAGIRKAWTGLDNALNLFTIQTENGASGVVLEPYGGNVGIGTATPVSELDVQGGDVNVSGQGRFKGWYTQGSGLAAEIGVSGGQSYIYSYDRTANAYKPMNLSGSTVGIGHNGGKDLYFDSTGNFYSYSPIASFTGNVGIGTASPHTTVQAVGKNDVNIWTGDFTNYYGGGSAHSFPGNQLGTFGDAYGNGSAYNYDTVNSSGSVQWWGGASGGYFHGGNGFQYAGGGAGIVAIGGDAGYEAPFGYYGNTDTYAQGGAGIYAQGGLLGDGQTRTFAGYFNGTTVVMNGNVGIGTKKPNYKLEVQGSVYGNDTGGGIGVIGNSTIGGDGVFGESSGGNGNGIVGVSYSGGIGAYGYGHTGIRGDADISTGSLAGLFNGNVAVNGNLMVHSKTLYVGPAGCGNIVTTSTSCRTLTSSTPYSNGVEYVYTCDGTGVAQSTSGGLTCPTVAL